MLFLFPLEIYDFVAVLAKIKCRYVRKTIVDLCNAKVKTIIWFFVSSIKFHTLIINNKPSYKKRNKEWITKIWILRYRLNKCQFYKKFNSTYSTVLCNILKYENEFPWKQFLLPYSEHKMQIMVYVVWLVRRSIRSNDFQYENNNISVWSVFCAEAWL